MVPLAVFTLTAAGPYSYQRLEDLSSLLVRLIITGAVNCVIKYSNLLIILFILIVVTANIQTSGFRIRRKGRTCYKPVGYLYPDVLENTDKFPDSNPVQKRLYQRRRASSQTSWRAPLVVSYLYNILVLVSRSGSVNIFHQRDKLKTHCKHKKEKERRHDYVCKITAIKYENHIQPCKRKIWATSMANVKADRMEQRSNFSHQVSGIFACVG